MALPRRRFTNPGLFAALMRELNSLATRAERLEREQDEIPRDVPDFTSRADDLFEQIEQTNGRQDKLWPIVMGTSASTASQAMLLVGIVQTDLHSLLLEGCNADRDYLEERARLWSAALASIYTVLGNDGATIPPAVERTFGCLNSAAASKAA